MLLSIPAVPIGLMVLTLYGVGIQVSMEGMIRIMSVVILHGLKSGLSVASII